MPSRGASVRRITAVRGRLAPGRRRPRRFWPAWLGGALAALALSTGGWLCLKLWPIPAGETVSLQIKTLEEAVPARAWVVREEKLFTAPWAGQVSHLAPEGQRARVGAGVVSIGGQTVQTDVAGIVSYQTDGLESVLAPAQAGRWTPSWLQSLPASASARLVEGPVAAGQPVFKIITDFSPGLVLALPAAQAPVLGPGAELTVRLGAAGKEVAATVEKRVAEGDAVLLHLKVQSIPPELVSARQVDLTLVLGVQTGKAVPRSAIDVRQGRQGVWQVQGSARSFVPVVVTGGNDREVILETDLPPGTVILKQAPLDLTP